MNKARRTRLDKIIEKLEEIKEELEEIKDEEEEAFYNLPESLQYSEKGDKMEDAIAYIEDASDDIDSVIDTLTEATQI